uniref:Uncharacterized protein n=1 Tax=Strigamia maritima TaxID=126957 RepID=T1J104_STRMM
LFFSQKEIQEINHINKTNQTNVSNGVVHQGDDQPTPVHHRSKAVNNQDKITNGYPKTNNNNVNDHSDEKQKKHIVGYLNLMANSIDNFTHGLAVAGSFLVSTKILTAGVGILGAITALSVDSIDSLAGMCVIWILPFTAGGFLNIALVNVLPELLREKIQKNLSNRCYFSSWGY